MTKFTIDMPASIFLRNVDGKPLYAKEEHFGPVLAKACEVGIKTVLTNVWNGGGKDATEAERFAAVEKKLAAWAAGNFNVVERGESQLTAMREAWVDEFRAANECSLKEAETFLRDTVKAAFGDDAKATFGNYLDATAAGLVKGGDFTDVGEAREALEAHYAKLADDAAKARAKTAAKLTAPKLDLSAFKKKAAK